MKSREYSESAVKVELLRSQKVKEWAHKLRLVRRVCVAQGETLYDA
jgi:hypothetical protein